MIMKVEPSEDRIRALRAALAELERKRTVKVRGDVRRAAKIPVRQRQARVILAPDVATTTVPGSMYSTMLRVLAARGRLALHEHLFTAFTRSMTPAAARSLLVKISVPRLETDRLVRADGEFAEHCAARTVTYKNRAAKGDMKARGILRNPKICRNGRWIGDLDDGVSILSGARTLRQVRRGKNVRILNRARLMFDLVVIGGVQRCILYRQRHHCAFRQAVALAQG